MLGYGYGYYFDPTYILVIIGAILSIWASSRGKRHLREVFPGAQHDGNDRRGGRKENSGL